MSEVRFQTTIESARGGGHFATVDREVAAKIGAKHRSRVSGTIADAEYRSNLVSMGGRLVLGVHKATLRATGARVGDTVQVMMTLDVDPLPDDEVPGLLAEALRADPHATSAWQALAPSHRRAHVAYILEAKLEETRQRRVERTLDRLRDGEAHR